MDSIARQVLSRIGAVEIQEVRQIVIDVALHTGMLLNISKDAVQQFLSGTSDLRLTTLDTESLALLEFCIIMEDNHGLSITPKAFVEHQTLGEIVLVLSDYENY